MKVIHPSLQTKVIGLLLLLFAALILLNILIGKLFIMPSFLALEREEAGHDLNRVVQAIDREVEHLTMTASDWGSWSDTWNYLRGENPGYPEANLTLDALIALKADLLFLYDSTGTPSWGMAVDRDKEEPRALPEMDGLRLARDHPLFPSGVLDQEVKGLLPTSRGPLMLAGHPVLTSDSRGPVMGMVVIGRFLDNQAVARLRNQAEVPFHLHAMIDAMPAREALLAERLGLSGSNLIESEERITRASHLMRDLRGRPLAMIEAEVPRDITARGWNAVHLALQLLALTCVCTLSLLIVSLRRLVLEPTRRLTEHAKELGQADTLKAIFPAGRRDELGVLAHELNRMVEQLAEARRRLLEQSWTSGAAEMAGGILHNIGNTLTPLTVQADTLHRELGGAPLGDLGLVLDELERPGQDGERRRDLLAFARLASEELRRSLQRADEVGQAMAGQIHHIGRILADQERFSRAERVLEPTCLLDLLRESAALVQDTPEARLEIRLDPSLDQAGEARVARVALQQVFSNLMINAAESLQRAGRDGWLRVSLQPGAERTLGLLHLVFEDNGAGIEAGHMEYIFKRGWSTKQGARTCGLGLHWCSNTLLAMGGGILAESAGAGRGATFHLTMPWAGAPVGAGTGLESASRRDHLVAEAA